MWLNHCKNGIGIIAAKPISGFDVITNKYGQGVREEYAVPKSLVYIGCNF